MYPRLPVKTSKNPGKTWVFASIHAPHTSNSVQCAYECAPLCPTKTAHLLDQPPSQDEEPPLNPHKPPRFGAKGGGQMRVRRPAHSSSCILFPREVPIVRRIFKIGFSRCCPSENPLFVNVGLSQGTHELFRVSRAESRSLPKRTEPHLGGVVFNAIGINRDFHDSIIVSDDYRPFNLIPPSRFRKRGRKWLQRPLEHWWFCERSLIPRSKRDATSCFY
ncbi:MAG: hypothetical protein RL518_1640 [Pseudomonadota bacterium]|jgi:hypothetical protein